jgi:hypothetical protein
MARKTAKKTMLLSMAAVRGGGAKRAGWPFYGVFTAGLKCDPFMRSKKQAFL